MSELTPQGNRFSRREWLLLLALLLMLEAGVLSISNSFKDDQSVLNYISFASTIASLLLAVLAIIYGFYQSDGQKSLAAEFGLRVSAMARVEQDLGTTAKEIASQLKVVSEASSNLKAISDSLDGAHTKLGTIEGGLVAIREQQSAFNLAVASASAKTRNTGARAPASGEITTPPKNFSPYDVANRVLRETSFQADTVGYALYQLSLRPDLLKRSLWHFIAKHIVEPLAAPATSTSSGDWLAISAQITAVLRAFDLIKTPIDRTTGEPIIVLSQALTEHLEKFAQETKASESTLKNTILIDQSFSPPKVAE
jgi:hypothetical protein